MSVLVDTNILLRSCEPGHASYDTARDAVAELRKQPEKVHVVPQNLYELWAVCTRPTSVNGLGMSPVAALAELNRFRALLDFLDDKAGICAEWQRLVVHHQVLGKNAH